MSDFEGLTGDGRQPGAITPGGIFVFGRPAASGPGSRLDSEAALRRYLLTRALGRAVVSTVQWTGVAILVVAVVLWLSGLKILGVLVGVLALVVLAVRALLSSLGRRISGADRLGPAEPQVARLVARTGRGLRRELRRVGLPGSPLAPMLIALRVAGPRRRIATVHALSRVELSRVVPADQVDELHLLLQTHSR